MRTIAIPYYGIMYTFHRGEWIETMVISHDNAENGGSYNLSSWIVDVDTVRANVDVAQDNGRQILDSAPFGTEV
jgi:hypothetical protein